MKLLSLLPVAAVAFSTSLDADLSAMKESLRGIALKAKKEGRKIDDFTRNTVETMLDQINSTLVDALYVDKAAAQSMLDTALRAVNQCADDRGTAFANDVASRDASQQRASSAHESCKAGDGAGLLQKRQEPETHREHDYGYEFNRSDGEQWHTEGRLEHTTHEVHAHGEEERLCRILNDTVRGFADRVVPQVQTDYCEDHDESDFTDLYRTNLQLVTNSHTWFRHMDTFDSEMSDDYKNKRDECHLARHRHVIRVQECNRLQRTFESAYCDYANDIDTTCHIYDGCYSLTHGEWVSTTSSVEDLETQFKLQQHALEHLLCYGNQILEDQTDLAACDALPCQGCDALSIIYIDPHAQIPCEEEKGSFRPCDGAWLDANYGQFADSDIPVDECYPCSEPFRPEYIRPEP